MPLQTVTQRMTRTGKLVTKPGQSADAVDCPLCGDRVSKAGLRRHQKTMRCVTYARANELKAQGLQRGIAFELGVLARGAGTVNAKVYGIKFENTFYSPPIYGKTGGTRQEGWAPEWVWSVHRMLGSGVSALVALLRVYNSRTYLEALQAAYLLGGLDGQDAAKAFMGPLTTVEIQDATGGKGLT